MQRTTADAFLSLINSSLIAFNLPFSGIGVKIKMALQI